jgi:hypothetical protein
MRKLSGMKVLLLVILACSVAGAAILLKLKSHSPAHLRAQPQARTQPQTQAQPPTALTVSDFKTSARFGLENHHSDLSLQGKSTMETSSAVVAHFRGLISSSHEGLDVDFFSKPMTEADLTDVLENNGRQMRLNERAGFILFLDKENRIEQVNMGYSVPGTSVSQTVAWKPDDLKKYFSDYSFDGKRLRLKSKGTFSDVNAEQQSMTLDWDVDFDVPVLDRRNK